MPLPSLSLSPSKLTESTPSIYLPCPSHVTTRLLFFPINLLILLALSDSRDLFPSLFLFLSPFRVFSHPISLSLSRTLSFLAVIIARTSSPLVAVPPPSYGPTSIMVNGGGTGGGGGVYRRSSAHSTPHHPLASLNPALFSSAGRGGGGGRGGETGGGGSKSLGSSPAKKLVVSSSGQGGGVREDFWRPSSAASNPVSSRHHQYRSSSTHHRSPSSHHHPSSITSSPSYYSTHSGGGISGYSTLHGGHHSALSYADYRSPRTTTVARLPLEYYRREREGGGQSTIASVPRPRLARMKDPKERRLFLDEFSVREDPSRIIANLVLRPGRTPTAEEIMRSGLIGRRKVEGWEGRGERVGESAMEERWDTVEVDRSDL